MRTDAVRNKKGIGKHIEGQSRHTDDTVAYIVKKHLFQMMQG